MSVRYPGPSASDDEIADWNYERRRSLAEEHQADDDVVEDDE